MLSSVSASGDPFTPNYGCFATDWGCQATQTIAGTLASTIQNMGDFIATMISGSFNTNIDSASWQAAHTQFLFWVAVTAPVIVVIALVQCGIAMVLQDWSRIGRTAAGAALAIPFSALCVWGMQQFSGLTDDVTGNLTAAVQGGGLSDGLLRTLGLVNTPGATSVAALNDAAFAKDSAVYGILNAGAAGQNAIGDYILAAFIVAIMAIASLFLFVAMAIREFGLLTLAAMAPIALMMVGQPKLSAWAQRWMSLTTGLLLAKPLAAGVILLAVQLTDSTVNLGLLIVAAGAVAVASFSPLWATRLVSFAGAEVGTALHHRISVRDQVSRASTALGPVRTVTKAIRP